MADPDFLTRKGGGGRKGAGGRGGGEGGEGVEDGVFPSPVGQSLGKEGAQSSPKNFFLQFLKIFVIFGNFSGDFSNFWQFSAIYKQYLGHFGQILAVFVCFLNKR